MLGFFKKFTKENIILWIVLTLILLGALALRLSVIKFSLWYDEGCSIMAAINSVPSGVNDYLWNTDLQHTPLYFYILHYIMQFFGDGEITLRVSSLIISMLTLPLTYVVATKLASKKAGIIAMILMSVNTFQVLYSIEIRMYPYVILLSLLAINYLIDYDRKGDTASLVKLGIVNLLNPYFLTGSFIFVLAQVVIYLIYLDVKKADPEKMTKYIVSNLILLIGFIPYFILMAHYVAVRSTFLVTDLSKFQAMNVWGLIQNLFSADAGHIHETRYEAFKMDFQTMLLVFFPWLILFVGLFDSFRDRERLNRVVFGVVVLSFLIFVLASAFGIIAFTGRYLIFISPFLFILTAVGFSRYNKYIVGTMVLIYAILCGYGLHETYTNYDRIAYFSLKAPADYVRENYPGKNNLVIMPFASNVSSYYFRGDDMARVMPLDLFKEVRNPNSTNIYDKEQIDAFKTGDKYKIFQKIILGNTFISKNFTEFMMKEINNVPKGAYIIWIVYYSDNYAILQEPVVKKIYSNYDNVKSHAMTGMLSKFDLDLITMLLTNANFVRRDRDDSNSYFVFQKK